VCDENGQCLTDCASDADCPKSDAFCSSYQCDAASAKCILILEPDGTVKNSDDCQLGLCDQASSETDADGDRITKVFAQLNDPCGAEFFCDGVGACGECNQDDHCGTTNDCLTSATCNTVDNTCVRICDLVGDNQDLAHEKNNCLKRVCTSECGDVVCSKECGDTIENDDNDLPTNECQTCSGGEVVNVANDTSPAGCNLPTYCFDGKCVGCVNDNECTNDADGDCGTPKCVEGSCDPDGNIDNGDVPDDMNECTDNLCTAGTPSNPSKNEGAACNMNSQVCDGAAMNPQCVDCA
jgi:hypothetical protein